MIIIQKFSDGSVLSFDKGAFDNWCVYLQPQHQQRYAPTDVAYFSRLQQLGSIHGHEKIYNDFVSFYSNTTHEIDKQILNSIRRIAASYHPNALEIEKLFTILYAGMIAEENKQFAVLKKRIKRLGMHQILIEQLPSSIAANFSKGKKWNELDPICKSKGF
jgi:hypothetical protein